MSTPTFRDLLGVSIEHMVSDRLTAHARPAGLVKLRVDLSDGLHGLGQLTPAQAREIAANLLNAAARAEYESDVILAAHASGGVEAVEAVGVLIAKLARSGEMSRMVEFGDEQ